MHKVGAHVLLAVFLLLLVSCQASVEGDAAGECADGADNDQDGMTDCDDDTCAADLACQGDDDDDDATDDDDTTDDDDSGSDDDDTSDDDDSSPIDPNEVDDDGDGQSEVDGDCDDTDPNNFSGNTELCDGEDNDCDGQPGATEVDLDEDGSLACEDCNDGDPAVELLDADGDGVTTCGGDCDDGNDTVHPGAGEIWDDGLDNDCDGLPDASNPACYANFTFDFPDGSSTTIDGCVDWSLDATYEYDPNDPPEVNSFTLDFNSTTSPGFECQILIIQEEFCGTGYYDTANDAQTITYTTLDCSGVANAYEGIYVAEVGYMHVHSLNTGVSAGDFTGIPFVTSIGGAIAVDDGYGVQVTGNFAVSIEQVAVDSEQQTTCAVSDGDEDNDGEIDVYFGGTDCDDQDPANFAGNIEICDGQDNDCNGLSDFYIVPPPGDDDDSAGDDDDSGLAGDDDDSGLAGDDDDSGLSGDDDDSAGLGYDSSELDLDGDGFLECADDCDDLSVDFSPIAPELCDGFDNDCDSVLPVNEADSDQDAQMECEGDCDDFDPANFLGNAESCDGQDNDCNGLDDANNPGVDDEETDNDTDGQWECQGDCDDNDALNFAGNPELCDGQDNDCNGLDDMDLPGTGGQEIDNDGDGQWPCQGDCNDDAPTLESFDTDGDSQTSCQGDCDDNNPAVFLGNTETPATCADGVDNGCDDASNQAPVANPGNDLVVIAYSQCTVGQYGGISCPNPCNFGVETLDGSGSSDAETATPFFLWTENSAHFSISSETTNTPSVSCASIGPANQVGWVGDYSGTVSLTVTDCDDSSATATVNVTCRCITTQ